VYYNKEDPQEIRTGGGKQLKILLLYISKDRSNKYISVTIIFLCIIIVIVKNNYRERTTCLKTFLAHVFKQTKTLVN